MRFIAVDLGGWFSVDEVLIAAEQLDKTTEGDWRVTLDEAALEGAPRWNEEPGRQLVDLRNWPPLIVGPFGATYSPILLYEQWLSETTDPAAAAGQELVARMHRASEVLGTKLSGPTGEIGTIEDISFAVEGMTLENIEVTLSGGTTGQTAHIPVQAVRHDDSGFATNLSQSDLTG